MTAHWIQVVEGKWKLRLVVIGFKGLSGSHSGENLGRYAVGLLDRVGIMHKTGSKASIVMSQFLSLIPPVQSFSQRHSIIQETITQLARLSKMSTSVGACSGIVTSDSCRTLIHLSHCPCIESLSSHSCSGHIVNLGTVAIMAHITKIAAVENATAIWEYDPLRNDNRILGGALDVIAAIHTLVIKVHKVFDPQFTSNAV